jgi:hypothetical protein
MSTRYSIGALGLAAVLLASGCASLAPVSPEEIVAKRAQAYFDAVVAKDYKTSYALHSPAYRERYTYEVHVMRSAGTGINYLSAKVLNVTCASAEACSATMEVTYKATGLRGAVDWPVTTVIQDRWAFVDNDWRRVPPP